MAFIHGVINIPLILSCNVVNAYLPSFLNDYTVLMMILGFSSLTYCRYFINTATFNTENTVDKNKTNEQNEKSSI